MTRREKGNRRRRRRRDVGKSRAAFWLLADQLNGCRWHRRRTPLSRIDEHFRAGSLRRFVCANHALDRVVLLFSREWSMVSRWSIFSIQRCSMLLKLSFYLLVEINMYVCTILDISNMIVGCLSRLIDLSVIFEVRVCEPNKFFKWQSKY